MIVLRGAVPFLVLAWAGAAARANPLHLLYVRGAGAERCPDAEALRARVAARLGYDPFAGAAAAPALMSVVLLRAPGGLRARIEIVDETGETRGTRELRARGGGCGELASAAELAISMAVDPIAFYGESGARARTSPPPPKESSPDEDEQPTPAPAARVPMPRQAEDDEVPPRGPVVVPDPDDDDELHVRIGAGAYVGLAAASTVPVGLASDLGLKARAWSVDFEGRFDVPTWLSTVSNAKTGLYYGALVPCARYKKLAFCSEFAAGARLASIGLEAQRSFPFLALGVRAALELPLNARVTARISTELLAAVYEGLPLFANQPVSGALQIALLANVR
jgi:hypothetical protein